jgi:sulfatase maturation enzyme AslB (radical SAM superfamily)
MIESQYFTIPLPRHPNYVAHVREQDYSLMFYKKTTGIAETSDSNETKFCQNLFYKYADLIAKRQPNNLIKEHKKKTFTTYLILTDSCNLQCIYCDVLSHPNYQNYGKKMTWEVAKTALDVIASPS